MKRISALLSLVLLPIACDEPPPQVVYEAVAVERRDIILVAHAAGTIEPDVTVEVKSKASGEILELPVETGDLVDRGALLVRIDQRQPRNTLAQAEAELEVARARLAYALSQLGRSEELFKVQSIPETAYDQAVLAHANAKAEVVRARVAVENARIAMDDTDVLAPITGTVIEKNVEPGQVISSPTRDVAGGTVLLKMADLALVRVRTLVDETDIGKIRPGMDARIVVAAYPDHVFSGSVMKIEPQSVTEQNVTMFPVLVRMGNRDGQLRPGMNCEVEIELGRRENVLAVPSAALRTPRDVDSAARVLGLSESDVRWPDGPQGAKQSALPQPGNRYIVFVQRDGTPVPVSIETGLTDFDYSEVLSGLSEGESVLVLPSASLVRSQKRFRDRLNRVTGGGLPGVRRSER